MKNVFKVHVEGKFEAFYDTIEKARACRKALQTLDYENIIITVTDEDINPYEKQNTCHDHVCIYDRDYYSTGNMGGYHKY